MPLLLVLPQISILLRPSLVMTHEQVLASKNRVEPEMMGIDRPFTDQDRLDLDEALDITTRHGEEVGSGAARG